MKFNLKEIKKATVFITPQIGELETNRYKFKATQILMWVGLYTLAIALLTIFFVGVTPLKKMLYHFEHKELQAQAERTVELERKVSFLRKEMESLSSTNKRLKFAYMLGTTDSIDSSSAIYDSLKYESKKNLPYGGNILYITKQLLSKFQQDDKEKKKIEPIFFLSPSKDFIIKDFSPKEGHLGIDFAAKLGSPIYTTQGGFVVFADFTLGDGNKIIIEHNNGFISIYKHCSSLLKDERDFVVTGELIALSGNSGRNTSGPHLHFELWKNGKPINPKELLIK
ncbi:MAG: M23 family metallopeptidase [Melioribacteraceae bacterium]